MGKTDARCSLLDTGLWFSVAPDSCDCLLVACTGWGWIRLDWAGPNSSMSVEGT